MPRQHKPADHAFRLNRLHCHLTAALHSGSVLLVFLVIFIVCPERTGMAESMLLKSDQFHAYTGQVTLTIVEWPA